MDRWARSTSGGARPSSAKREKQAKVAAANLWVPAVNNWGRLGRRTFLEVTHMENAAELSRSRYLA